MLTPRKKVLRSREKTKQNLEVKDPPGKVDVTENRVGGAMPTRKQDPQVSV